MIKNITLSLALALATIFIGSTSSAQCVGDFNVATPSGETVINICFGNTSTIVVVAADIRGFPIMYVLTDDNGIILSIGTHPVFNFRNAPPGVCRIYAATFKGRIFQPIGEHLADAELTSFCAELSTNYVTVIRGSADESTVSLTSGSTDTTFCSRDALVDVVTFDHSATSQAYTYLITDDQGNIMALSDGSFDFEGAPAGTCFIYGLSYDGLLLAEAGMTIDDPLSVGCFALSDNRIAVTRVTTDPGSITTSSGSVQDILCVGDGMADSITFISPGADTSANYQLIVTGPTDTIIALPVGNVIDFEGAGTGICRIYGMATTGNLIAVVGQPLSSITTDGLCIGLTQGYVKIIRTFPDAGSIQTLTGDTLVYTCPGDGAADIVNFNIVSGLTPFLFIITDENGQVISVTTDQSIDFEPAGEGTCFVYRASFTGTITIAPGDDLSSTDISDGCFELTPNAVEIRRASPAAGHISTTSGDDVVDVCVGDGLPDIFTFDAEFKSGLEFTLVITDDQNQILMFLGPDDEINFELAGSGVCRVYGISYHGDLLVAVGDDLMAGPIASSCADLTDNFVEFRRSNVDPGVIFTQLGTEVLTCPGDGVADFLYITQQSNADTSIVFITDGQGIVLAILTNDTLNLEGAGEGVCSIWSLSFDGEVLIAPGDTLDGQALATGCHGLADPVVVTRRVPYADVLTTIDGDTTVEFCTADGMPDLLILNYNPSVDFPIEYVITDTFGIILGASANDTIDFEGVPAGVCRVYGVAYTGSFTGVIGENIGATMLSDNCDAISDNYVQVTRIELDGGDLTFNDGETIKYTCPGDGIDDILHFNNSSQSAASIQYIITDGAGVIIALPMADSMNVENAPIGVCRVWSAIYVGTFIGEIGDTVPQNIAADGCYALSNNFLTVVRDTAEAGFVTDISGDTLFNFNTADTFPDAITAVAHGASMANGNFIVTTSTGLILAVFNGNFIDFGAVPGMEYRIYYVSYTGNITIMAGLNISIDPVSDECWDVSDNFIRILVTENLTDDDDLIEGANKNSTHSFSSLTAFPNPLVRHVYFQNDDFFDRAILMSTQGDIVVEQNDLWTQNYSFATSDLVPGIYILTVYQNGKPLGQQKVIKQ